MTVANPRLMFNYDDYCLLPEDKRVELIGGDFCLVPSPSVIHQRVAANVEDILRAFVRDNALGEVFDRSLNPPQVAGLQPE